MGFLYDRRPFALLFEGLRLLAGLVLLWNVGAIVPELSEETQTAIAAVGGIAMVVSLMVIARSQWNTVELGEEERRKKYFIRDYGRAFEAKLRAEEQAMRKGDAQLQKKNE